MKLCVGAVSKRVIQEAAALKVHQIVASRRQVDVDGGYTGYNQSDLVKVVHAASGGVTHVIRDHGGPLQGGTADDGIDSLEYDVRSRFDGLHLDVCELPKNQQKEQLLYLARRFGRQIDIEVGGEHDSQSWNDELLDVVVHEGIVPRYAVVGAGTYVWADKQYGSLYHTSSFQYLTRHPRDYHIPTKAHNMDFVGNRKAYDSMINAYNLAPELGMVEVSAILQMMNYDSVCSLLLYAYESELWRRWFHDDEGTWNERAQCAVRYLLEDEKAKSYIHFNDDQEDYVRGCIRDAIRRG